VAAIDVPSKAPSRGRAEEMWIRRRLDPRDVPHVVAGAVVVLVGIFVLPEVLDGYWLNTFIQIAIYSMVALGLGLLVGRVGIFSLGQIAILAIGSWTAARLDYATTLPFPVILLAAGGVAGVCGILVGLPALRLSGLDLALVTLMMAGAVTVVLDNTNFPNGGHGFIGYTSSPYGLPSIRRPSLAAADPAYLRYAVIVALLMFLLVLWQVRSKPGRAWATIRQSESAAVAAGVNVTLYKLWAFALAAIVTGIAGGVLASSAPELYNTQFAAQQSIELLAVVLMGGAFNLWGAVAAGMFLYFIPAVLNTWSISSFLLIILFGVGVIYVLVTAPTGLAGQLPKDLSRLKAKLAAIGGRGRGATRTSTSGVSVHAQASAGATPAPEEVRGSPATSSLPGDPKARRRFW